MKRISIMFFLCTFYYISYAQEFLRDRIYEKKIKTVLAYKEGNKLNLPVIELNSNEKLTVCFDEITSDANTYFYTIIHCNSNWEESELYMNEYINGFSENEIYNYKYSYNTTVNYVHYSFKLPNNDIEFLISGNYIIKVYKDNNPENLVFTKRFMINESKVNIDAEKINKGQTGYFYNKQELKVVVNNEKYGIEDLQQNIQLVIVKNNDWTNFISKIGYNSIVGNKIIYYNPNKLKFEGGNEFHNFNTKDIYYKSENIERIDFIANKYNFLLTSDVENEFSEYNYKKDLNGAYFIDVINSENPNVDADYVNVFFTLNMNVPLQKGDVYVWGALTNYNFTNDNKMRYNYNQKAYEISLLLKQGYYNYSYITKSANNVDYNFIDGNYSLTENEYLILVYYKDISMGYDKLIGAKRFVTKQ